MTKGAASDAGLVVAGVLLFECALEGGAEALSTQLVEAPVVPGSQLVFLVESNAGDGSVGDASRVDGSVGDAGDGSVGDASRVDASARRLAPTIIWGEPAFSGPAGEVGVLDLGWQALASLPGSVVAWRASGGGELLLGGRPCDAALLMKAPAALRVRVPSGAERLVVECGFDCDVMPGPLVRARCSVYRETPG